MRRCPSTLVQSSRLTWGPWLYTTCSIIPEWGISAWASFNPILSRDCLNGSTTCRNSPTLSIWSIRVSAGRRASMRRSISSTGRWIHCHDLRLRRRSGRIGRVKDFRAAFGVDDVGAHQEVTEAFIRLALSRETLEHRVEGLENGGGVDVFPIEAVHALAALVSAQVEVVLADRLAGEADLGQEGPGAAVGAAGDAHIDRRVGEAVLVHHGVEFADQAGQVALGFRHGQTTGGEGHA